MNNHTNENNVHNGHRKRMREKFQAGKEAMQDHEILEMLLYATIPRVNTNLQAHELFRKGGNTLNGVLELDEKAITDIPGLSETTATYIQLLREFNVRLKREKLNFTNERKITKANVIQKLRKHFEGYNEERMIMMTADCHVNHINTHVLSSGTDSATIVPIKKMLHLALDDKAMFVFIAHNHPNGILAPTKEDIDVTNQIRNTLSLIDVMLVEHYIITEKSDMGIINKHSSPSVL